MPGVIWVMFVNVLKNKWYIKTKIYTYIICRKTYNSRNITSLTTFVLVDLKPEIDLNTPLKLIFFKHAIIIKAVLFKVNT